MFCTYCGREFARREHLQRHLLTHTKVKAFKCSICNLSFARRDLVQKHFAVHSQGEIATACDITSPQNSTLTTVSPTQSRRNVIACFHCAKTKTKCDRQYPCRRCQQKHIACVPQPQRRYGHSKATRTRDEIGGAVTSVLRSPEALHRVSESILENRTVQDTHALAREATTELGSHSLRPEDCIAPVPEPEAGSRTSHNPPSVFNDLSELSPGNSVQLIQTSNSIDLLEDGDNPHEVRTSVGENAGQQTSPQFHEGNHPSMVTTFPGPSSESEHLVNSFDLNKAFVDDIRVADAGDQFPPSDMLSDANLFALDAIPDFSKLQYFGPHDLGLLEGFLNFQGPFATTLESATLLVPPVDLQQDPTAAGSEGGTGQLEAVEQWTIFQCTPLCNDPPPYTCHRLVAYLECNFRCPGAWTVSAENWRNKHFLPHERFTNVSLMEENRERMMIIAQYFLRVAIDSHGPEHQPHGPNSYLLDDRTQCLSLPTTKILAIFLETFLASFEPYYPLNPARALNPNRLAPSSNEKGATLLLLLMISYGAMREPTTKAQHLAVGIAEVSRLAIVDHLEKDNYASRRALTLYSGLLSTLENAFGGEKWHMDMAMGQRHAYLTMMRHSGFFRWVDPKHWFNPKETKLDNTWKAWIEMENISRLAYGWVLADQEISLIYDSQPVLTVTELEVMLPAGDEIWLAANAADWARSLGANAADPENIFLLLSQKPQISLRRLFQLLLDNKLNTLQAPAQILQMRLLLFPIQVLVHQQNQLRAILPGDDAPTRGSRRVLEISSAIRSDDVECLLQRWKLYFGSLSCEGTRLRLMQQASLIIFHLINIDLEISIGDIERSIRGETSTWINGDGNGMRDQMIRSPDDLIFHCGQILRIISEIEVELRPLWWSAAVYRAAVALWACSVLTLNGRGESFLDITTSEVEYVAIDRLPDHDPTLQDYIQHRKSQLCLTARDGVRVAVRNPSGVLTVCIGILDCGPLAMKLCQGASWKLKMLLKTWERSFQTEHLYLPGANKGQVVIQAS